MQADSSDEWRQLAVDALAAAKTLLDGQHWQQAFQLAGFAVECALKCRIMRGSGMNRWPSRKEKREVYSHDLSALARIAGLQAALLKEIEDISVLGLAWVVAQGWDNEMRYIPGPFPSVRAKDMVEAVDAGGLLQWLLTPTN